MTTVTLTQKRTINPFPILPIIIAILLATTVTVSAHAVLKHGNDALDINDCLNKNGPYQVWKSTKFDNQYFRICQLDDGRWGLDIVFKENGKLDNVTAFVKGDGSWGQLMKYLGRIATRFNGVLPP